MDTKKQKLKRPTVIYFLAFGFIMGPFLSFFYSLFLFKERPEFSWRLIVAAISAIEPFDLIWMTLCFIAGCLLFIRSKLTWTFALVILTSIVFLNIYNAFPGPNSTEPPLSFWIQGILNLVITVVGLVIVSYFRFPYLDRRMPWINNFVRYDIQHEAKLLQPQAIDVVIENISKGGALLKIKETANLTIDNKIIQFSPDQILELDLNPWIDGKVQAQIVMQTGNACRVKFTNLSSLQTKGLDQWIKTLREAS